MFTNWICPTVTLQRPVLKIPEQFHRPCTAHGLRQGCAWTTFGVEVFSAGTSHLQPPTVVSMQSAGAPRPLKPVSARLGVLQASNCVTMRRRICRVARFSRLSNASWRVGPQRLRNCCVARLSPPVKCLSAAWTLQAIRTVSL